MTSDRSGPLVYACHPMATYGTPWAAHHVARLVELLPGVEVLDPEHCGWDTNDAWHSGWPGLLATLAGLVVFGAPDDTVGAGCLVELADVIAARLPVAALDIEAHPERGLVELAGFELLPATERTPSRAARLRSGGPMPSPFAHFCKEEEL